MSSKKERSKVHDEEQQEIKTKPETPIQSQVAATVSTDPEQLIYIGPSIRKDGAEIRTNRIFIGGRPAYLEPLYTEYPLIKALFVPVEMLQESLQQINQAGTALHTAVLSLKGV